MTFTAKKETLRDVLTLIEQNSDYRFLYGDNPVFEKDKLSVRVVNANIDEVMTKILSGTGLHYTINNKDLVILSPSPSVFNVSFRSVTGVVLNERGSPIPGVSVTVKGSNKGTTTNANGEFTIDAQPDDILVFSFIGYASVEQKVGTQERFSIALAPGTRSMEEVVVVGYGTQKKVNLTGSVASVGADKLENRPIVNLADGLVGLIPNLNVNLGSGQPGTEAKFNIRGMTTISGGNTSPLVLVDGVQRDPNLIDPNNVESVTVLKDASSAAIYGGRAAYGVILITTKNAHRGSAPQVSYSGSYTTSRPTNLPKYVDSKGYIDLFNSAQRTGAATGGYTSSDPLTATDSTLAANYRQDPAHNPDAYVDPGNPNRYRYVGNTDWVKVMYPGWAPQQEHFLSLSGSGGKTSYVGSMGYFTQDGLEKVANQVYKRYTPSLKINSEITSWLTVDLNMSMTHTGNNGGAATRISQGGPTNGSWIPGDLRPLQPVYNPDGHFSGQGNYSNPVAILTLSGRDINTQNDYWTTGRATLKPVKHLTITSDFTWNAFADFDKANLIPFNEYGVNGAFLDIFPWTNPSQVSQITQNNYYTALNAYATYENTWGKHYLKVLGGYNQEYQHYKTDETITHDLIDPTVPAIGVNNDPKPTVTGEETDYALVGTFYRVNYIYDQRFMLEVNGRYDGTSRFAPDHRYVFSPSASAGWDIAQEKWMKDMKGKIDELKIRASYGVLPNQLAPTAISAANQYPYIATMPTSTVSYLFNGQPGVTVGAPGLISSNFSWEKVETKNIGLDYSILNDRLSGSADYFITYTKDMLVPSAQLPAVLGTTAPLANAADLRTNGWELSVTWKDNALNKKLFYSVTLGLSDNYSTITRYGGNPTGNISSSTYRVGERLGEIWGYTTQGFYKTDAEAAAVDNSALAGYTWLAGDIKYADLNHDGKIGYGNNTVSNPGDQKIIGNSTPRYKFGLNLNLGYKGFDFAAFAQGVLKAKYNPVGSNVFNPFPNDEYGIPYAYGTNSWSPDNTNAYFGRPRFAGGGNEQTQTKFLQNAAFARIKQLTLGYSLPKATIGRWSIQRVRVYVTGANLITITSLFKGVDPEIVNYQGGYNTYPINKSVSFGVQVTL
jgi:TonB-linked SusC/RagA family outer membrane protein